MASGPVYRVLLSTEARRALEKLPSNTRHRLAIRIDALALDPRPTGTRALQGAQRLLRLRVGDYRLVYSVEDRDQVVRIVRVGHRRDIYRGL
ncbi:MAG: type II toxin-antitoxin system RelE/ParE family toxin [Dehalococcoidia bacterium]